MIIDRCSVADGNFRQGLIAVESEERFHELAQTLQVIAGAGTTGRLSEFVHGTKVLAEALPIPSNFAEESLLRRLLRDFVRNTELELGDVGVDAPPFDDSEPAGDTFRQWAGALQANQLLLGCVHSDLPEPIRTVLRTMIREHHHTLRIRDLATPVGWSVCHLCDVFRRTMGLTVHQCITRIRIAHAAAILRTGVKPEAAALLVGYRSATHFYKAFTRLVGCTPGAFARRTSTRPD